MEDNFSFDLDAYASRYYGRGKIQRLRFIAEKSSHLRKEALRLAVLEARKGRDTRLYKDIVAQAEEPLGGGIEMDNSWIRETDRWAAKELEKLRRELEDNKQQEIKEVIRTGHNDLGDFFRKRGKLQQARGDYIKTRDYCMHSHHTVQMCMNVITVSIEAEEYSHVENHYLHAENTPDIDKMAPDMAKMRACAGLALFVRKHYALAASRFLAVNSEENEEKVAILAKEFGDAMALEDVATYGGLCALATMQRSAIAKQVIEKPQFRNLLELVPDIREIIHDFHNARYTRCLETMDRIRPDLMLDMYIGAGDHIDSLYRLIRRKAIVQYVSPFISADLRRMQKVFSTTPTELEEELLTLIEEGAIHARIDTEHHALHAKQSNPRAEAIKGSLTKGREAFEEAEAMLLRMNLLKHNIQISNAPTGGSGGGGMGPRGTSLSSVADSVFDRGFRH